MYNYLKIVLKYNTSIHHKLPLISWSWVAWYGTGSHTGWEGAHQTNTELTHINSKLFTQESPINLHVFTLLKEPVQKRHRHGETRKRKNGFKPRTYLLKDTLIQNAWWDLVPILALFLLAMLKQFLCHMSLYKFSVFATFKSWQFSHFKFLFFLIFLCK